MHASRRGNHDRDWVSVARLNQAGVIAGSRQNQAKEPSITNKLFQRAISKDHPRSFRSIAKRAKRGWKWEPGGSGNPRLYLIYRRYNCGTVYFSLPYTTTHKQRPG